MVATDTHPNRRTLESMFEDDTFKSPEFEYQHRTVDFVAEMPQEGKRIEGRDALRRLQEQFKEPPRVQLLRITGSGDFWAVETRQAYEGEGEYHVCILVEFREGKIARETRYYGPPLDRTRG